MERPEIRFKSLNKGVGLYKEPLNSYSHYNKDDEDRLLSKYSTSVFLGLDVSGDNYDELEKRLEQPILDSLKKKELEFVSKPIRKNRRKEIKENLMAFEFEQDNPLNRIQIPPLEVMGIDYGFSLGMYLLGGSMIAALFNFSFMPSMFSLILAYFLFHQVYVVVCRSCIGATLGEERYNLGWDSSSVFRFIVRGIFVTLTGFIFIPLLSALFKKDLLQGYTGLRLRYNI